MNNVKRALLVVVSAAFGLSLAAPSEAANTVEGKVKVLTLYSTYNQFDVSTTHTDNFCGGRPGHYILDMNAPNAKYLLAELQAAKLSQRPVIMFYSACVTQWGMRLPLLDAIQVA